MKSMSTAVLVALLCAASNAVAQDETQNAATQPALEANNYLAPSRDIAAGEECDEFVTGQFYFKICRNEERIVNETVKVKVRKKCVVYDPVNCCNTVVWKWVTEDRIEPRTQVTPMERVYCKKWKLRVSEIENAEECKCLDSEFLNDEAAHNHDAAVPAASGDVGATSSSASALRAEIARLKRQLEGERRVSAARIPTSNATNNAPYAAGASNTWRPATTSTAVSYVTPVESYIVYETPVSTYSYGGSATVFPTSQVYWP